MSSRKNRAGKPDEKSKHHQGSSQDQTQSGKGNAEASGANEQANASRGGATGAGAVGSGSQDPEQGGNAKGDPGIGGPDGNNASGENEDVDNDGAKEKGVHNSAKGDQQSSVPQPWPPASQGAAAPEPEQDPDKEELQKQQDTQAQVNLLGNIVGNARSLSNTLKSLGTTTEFFTTEKVKDAEAALDEAVSEANDVLTKKLNVSAAQLGLGVDHSHDKTVSLAQYLTPLHKVHVIQSNINSLIGTIDAAVDRGGDHSVELDNIAGHLEDAVDALSEALKA